MNDLKQGSGSGDYVRGRKITSIRQLKAGDLLIEDNWRLNATNIVRIEEPPTPRTPGYGVDLIYCTFRDPHNYRQRRQFGDDVFAIHQFDFMRTKLYRAKLPASAFPPKPRKSSISKKFPLFT